MKKHKNRNGLSQTPHYQAWFSMKDRCRNKKNPGYKNYGGRWIDFCERWEEFSNFYEDMGPRKDGESLERINNDGNYEPSNCRWATRKEQQRNTRQTISYKGECASDASIRLGGVKTLVHLRIRQGWDIERAFNQPKQSKKPRSNQIKDFK